MVAKTADNDDHTEFDSSVKETIVGRPIEKVNVF